MKNYPTPREVPGARELPPRQNQGSGERIPLSNATLDRLPKTVSIPAYDRGKISAGIVHFGVGNFHRAHEALFVDRCLHLSGQEGWGIVGVGLGAGIEKRAKARAIKAQDGLYTLSEYAPDGSVEMRVVGALLDYLYAPLEAEAVLNRLAHPDTRIYPSQLPREAIILTSLPRSSYWQIQPCSAIWLNRAIPARPSDSLSRGLREDVLQGWVA